MIGSGCYCTCVTAQLSEPVSPLQLGEAAPALGNMAPTAQPLGGVAPLPLVAAVACGQSGMLLQCPRSVLTACDNPSVESLVRREVSRVESVSLIST
jgi:hypothetical protein